MFFQDGSGMAAPELIGITIALILIDILLLKLALIITNAQEKRNMKWVLSSFGIQLGIVFFIGSPLILYGMIGAFEGDEGMIIMVVLFAIFIDLNVINILHKIGLKRSLVVMILVVGPIVFVIYSLGNFLGGVLQFS
ncbi:MAG: hypothetical protein ACFFC3_11955 [Candidatus Odinarchaeota archaeon]